MEKIIACIDYNTSPGSSPLPPRKVSDCCSHSIKGVICSELSFVVFTSKLRADVMLGHEWKYLFLRKAHSCAICDIKDAYYPTDSFFSSINLFPLFQNYL